MLPYTSLPHRRRGSTSRRPTRNGHPQPAVPSAPRHSRGRRRRPLRRHTRPKPRAPLLRPAKAHGRAHGQRRSRRRQSPRHNCRRQRSLLSAYNRPPCSVHRKNPTPYRRWRCRYSAASLRCRRLPIPSVHSALHHTSSPRWRRTAPPAPGKRQSLPARFRPRNWATARLQRRSYTRRRPSAAA